MKYLFNIITLALLGFGLMACSESNSPPAANNPYKAVQTTQPSTQASTQPATTRPANISAMGYDVTRIAVDKEVLKQRLTPIQYHVTMEEGTERPFTHKYDKNYKKGVYVCVVCELPLFSSEHKYDSKSGWPSYWQPIDPQHIGTKFDGKFGWNRTEVHCARTGAHLGHVFNDGPKPTGQRWCINGASLKFIPADKE